MLIDNPFTRRLELIKNIIINRKIINNFSDT